MLEIKNAGEKLEERLDPIRELLQKHKLVETLVHQQQDAPRQEIAESLLQRQQRHELRAKLERLPAPEVDGCGCPSTF